MSLYSQPVSPHGSSFKKMVQGPSWESAESEAIESKVSSPINTSVNVLGIVIF